MTNTSFSKLPPAYSFAASQLWDGVDGSWSSFIVRVGTPEQSFRVLPSTTGRATWLPRPEACRPIDPAQCGQLRGGFPSEEWEYGFNITRSSTWEEIGPFELDNEKRLNISGNGEFGFDTVGLQIGNSGGLQLKHQVVAGFITQKYWNGQFGLDSRPSNFSDFNNPQPSFMSTLKKENMIPSLSYGYTAGASYRQPKVFGSLTLGGYDASKFDPPSGSADHSFPFNSDDSRSLSLGVQSITSSVSLIEDGPQGLLTAPIVSLIDTSVPHIWLPRAACDDFEARFGLSYDARTGFYVLNDTVHTRLQQLNPSFTFVLGNTNDPSKVVNIKIPYAAFDLQASWPIYNETTHYFPIRRATNDTQYTLGRAFLQETYLIADYERANFSIYQTRFQDGTTAQAQEIVSIISPTFQNATEVVGKSKLSKSALIGANLGSVIGASLLMLLFFLFMRRRRRAADDGKSEYDESWSPTPPEEPARLYEMYNQPQEVVGDKVQFEIDSKTVHMMSDDRGSKWDKGNRDAEIIHEMPAARLSDAKSMNQYMIAKYGEGNWI